MSRSKDAATSRQDAARRSRTLFLDEGLRLLSEGLESPFRTVRAKDVVARTDLTTGAFYHHWTNQDDYRESLLEHLADFWDPGSPAERFQQTVGQPGQDDSILNLFVAEIRSVAQDPAWWLEVAMLCSADRADVAHVRRHMGDWVESMSALYSAIFAEFGLELRDGCSTPMLARAVMALVDGFSLQVRAGMQLEQDVETGEWGSVEWSIAGVICAMVHDEAETGGDLRTTWSRLFGDS